MCWPIVAHANTLDAESEALGGFAPDGGDAFAHFPRGFVAKVTTRILFGKAGLVSRM